jgi:hypothetical protein
LEMATAVWSGRISLQRTGGCTMSWTPACISKTPLRPMSCEGYPWPPDWLSTQRQAGWQAFRTMQMLCPRRYQCLSGRRRAISSLSSS